VKGILSGRAVATGPAPAGPVLVCLADTPGGDAVLRFAFAEADRRGAPLHVLVTGPASAVQDAVLHDLIERWAEKYPAVPVTTRVSRGIDAAVSLTAATRGCGQAVVAEPADAGAAAVLHALSRRTHCPVAVVGETTARPVPSGATTAGCVAGVGDRSRGPVRVAGGGGEGWRRPGTSMRRPGRRAGPTAG
jgi:hypothetical protein